MLTLRRTIARGAALASIVLTASSASPARQQARTRVFAVASCGARVTPAPSARLNVALFHRTATHYGHISFLGLARDAKRRRLWIGQGVASGFVGPYAAAHPGILSFLYKDAVFVDRFVPGPATAGQVLGGVSYQMALTSGWLVLDNAQPIVSRGYAGFVLADLADPGYQREWARNAIAEAHGGGWSGVFADDLGLFRPDLTASPPAFPTQAAWREAVRAFLAGVSPLLHASGLSLIANISDGIFDLGLHRLLVRYLDGSMDEGWMRHTTRHTEALANGCEWVRQLVEELQSEASRKRFLAELPADATDARAIAYGLATFLLGANGYSSFDVAGNPHYANAIWTPELQAATRLGPPLGSFTVARSGLYSRAFRRGLVLVNPTGRRITARVRPTRRARRRTVSLAPSTGVILVRR